MKMLMSFLLAFSLVLFLEGETESAWIWTPESGRWINPKYSIKDTPQEQYEWAMRIVDLGEYHHAIKRLRQLIKKFPQSPYAAKSQFGIGLAYERWGKTKNAIEEYHKVAENYPYSPDIYEVVEAEYRLGNIILNREGGDTWQKIITYEGNYELAAKIFDQAIRIAPFGPALRRCSIKSARPILKLKNMKRLPPHIKWPRIVTKIASG